MRCLTSFFFGRVQQTYQLLERSGQTENRKVCLLCMKSYLQESCSYHRPVEKYICTHWSKPLWLSSPRPGWSIWKSGLNEGLWIIFSIRVTISGKRHLKHFLLALWAARAQCRLLLFYLTQGWYFPQRAWSSSVLCRYRWSQFRLGPFTLWGLAFDF